MKQYFIGFFTGACLIASAVMFIGATDKNLGDITVNPISESDIKKLAQEINNELKGMSFENGIVARGCIAFRRTIVYQYEVPDNWYPAQNMKEDLIANLNMIEFGKTCS